MKVGGSWRGFMVGSMWKDQWCGRGAPLLAPWFPISAGCGSPSVQALHVPPLLSWPHSPTSLWGLLSKPCHYNPRGDDARDMSGAAAGVLCPATAPCHHTHVDEANQHRDDARSSSTGGQKKARL